MIPLYESGSRRSLVLDFGIGFIIPFPHSVGIMPVVKQTLNKICKNETEQSMYSVVKSRVKFDNKLGSEFICALGALGVRQGECLSPMLFSLFLNDLEEVFATQGYEGLDINIFKIFMLLYADDIVIFSKSAEELQEGLSLLLNYCNRWKLKVNVDKTKIMVFRNGGALPENLMFYYDNHVLEIVTKFKYLGIVFTAGGSFSECQNTLAGQAHKAIFQLNRYLYKFNLLFFLQDISWSYLIN